MAKSTIGSMAPFIEGEEEFESYAQRCENWLKINKVTTEEDKLLYFLTLIGPKAYALVKSLVFPKKPEESTYTEVKDALIKHYKPQKNPVYERFVFYQRNQKAGESISNYVASLKALAGTCEFKDNLVEMLRDRFIQGISNSETQHLLLSDPTMTFDKAVDLAKGREAATKEVEGLGQSTSAVHQVMDKNKSYPKQKKNFSAPNKSNSKFPNTKSVPNQPCSGCGKKHWKADCPFKDAECFKCQQKGHISKVCRNPAKAKPKAEKNNFINSNREDY